MKCACVIEAGRRARSMAQVIGEQPVNAGDIARRNGIASIDRERIRDVEFLVAVLAFASELPRAAARC